MGIFAKIKDDVVINVFVANTAFVDKLKSSPNAATEFDEIIDVSQLDPHPAPGDKKVGNDFVCPFGGKTGEKNKVMKACKELEAKGLDLTDENLKAELGDL